MLLGLIGKKLGMIRIFDKYGKSLAITLVYIAYNYINKLKKNTIKIYCFFKKINFKNFFFFYYKNYNNLNKIIKEYKVSVFDFNRFIDKTILPLNIFFINQFIDITAFSKGKGFAGVVKKHNFKSGKASHGASKSHNLPGSIGMCQDPGRVFRGKKMAGHLGFNKVTIKNLKIIKIDFRYNVIFIKGSLPGSFRNYIYIYFSKKT